MACYVCFSPYFFNWSRLLVLHLQTVCLPKLAPIQILNREALAGDAYAKYVKSCFDIVEIGLATSDVEALVRVVRAGVAVGTFTPASSSGSKGADAAEKTATGSHRHAPGASVPPPIADLARDVVEIGLSILSRNDFDVLPATAEFGVRDLVQSIITVVKAGSASPHNIVALQVCRRLCGLSSPSAARGQKPGARVVNVARISTLASFNLFRDIAHTLMPKMDDVAYIREAIRLLSDAHQGEGLAITALALDPRSLGAVQCCARKYGGDEFLVRTVGALSAALSDVFIEASGKGLVKYVREALSSLEAAGGVVRRKDKTKEGLGSQYFEVGTGRSKQRQLDPPDQYKAVIAALAPLERMGYALDPEGGWFRCDTLACTLFCVDVLRFACGVQW
jgi:hypothetical protein